MKRIKKTDDLENLKNHLARALADYDNLRKRSDSEKESWEKYSSQKILIKLIPCLDMLESAQDHLKDQGLAIVVSDFKRVLCEEGLEEISPKTGDIFNPQLHEAVEAVSGGKKGTIAKLNLKGWRFSQGPILRHAKTVVFGDNIKKEDKNHE